jgi:hypothetical protein
MAPVNNNFRETHEEVIGTNYDNLTYSHAAAPLHAGQ